MTQADIRAKRGQLLKELEEAQVLVREKQYAMKVLQLRCRHPFTSRTGDYSGDSYSYCVDCGKEPV